MTSFEAVAVFGAVATPLALIARAVSPMVVAYINGRSAAEVERIRASAELCRMVVEKGLGGLTRNRFPTNPKS